MGWDIETIFREIKGYLAAEGCLATTPDGVEKELLGACIAQVMAAAAEVVALTMVARDAWNDPRARRCVFTHCLEVIAAAIAWPCTTHRGAAKALPTSSTSSASIGSVAVQNVLKNAMLSASAASGISRQTEGFVKSGAIGGLGHRVKPQRDRAPRGGGRI